MTKTEAKYWRSVHSKRQRGIYHTEDTLAEAKVCFSQMTPDDKVFTLVHRLGAFNMYNNREFLPQVSEWKRLGCELLDCNVWPIDINGKEAYMFIIQPKNLESTPISPLALAFNKLVNGYAYITPHKSTIEMVQRILS